MQQRKPKVVWVSSEIKEIQDRMFIMLAKAQQFPLMQFPHTVFRDAQGQLVREKKLYPDRTREYLSEDQVKEWKKALNERGNKFNHEVFTGARHHKDVPGTRYAAPQEAPREEAGWEGQVHKDQLKTDVNADVVLEKLQKILEPKRTPLQLIELGLNQMVDARMSTLTEAVANLIRDLAAAKETINTQTQIINELVDIVTKPLAPTDEPAVEPVHTEASLHDHPDLSVTPVLDPVKAKPKIAVASLLPVQQQDLLHTFKHLEFRFIPHGAPSSHAASIASRCDLVYSMTKFISHPLDHGLKDGARGKYIPLNGAISQLKEDLTRRFGLCN